MKRILTTLLFLLFTTIALFSQTIGSIEINSTFFPAMSGIYIPSGIVINGCECYENSVNGRVFIASTLNTAWGPSDAGETCATTSGNIISSIFISGTDACDLSQLTPIPGLATISINFITLVPTLSQWGLIILAILLLTIGIVYARQSQMATESSNFSLSLQQLPFELSTYRNIWLMVACIIVAVFTVLIQFLGYEMTQADPFGVAVSSFLLAYLVFLLKK